ncbi:hypothetical protein ACFL5P_00400 [candidate division KSB1 bacterium]
MPYKDKDCLKHISPLFVELINLCKSAKSQDEKRWYNSVLDRACRHMEYFIKPCVSVKAYQKAQALGLGDIRRFEYSQRNKIKVSNIKVFHFEHVFPVGDMRKKLLSVKNPTSEAVEEVLEKADIAWVLVEEDKKLISLGYNSHRPDNPWDAYREAGIEIYRKTI